ncbi:MAG: hypothetical protein ACFFCI_01775 [Promethearchaeota archaeon]
MIQIAYSPPKKITIIVSFLLLVLGMVFGIIAFLGYAGQWLSFLAIGGYSARQVCYVIGFGLCGLAWLLIVLGVMVRGL